MKPITIARIREIVGSDRVADFSDERRNPDGSNDGLWVYLTPGWIFDHETHLIHSYTLRELQQDTKRVTRCNCEDCVRNA